jgi:hypothetical protein
MVYLVRSFELCATVMLALSLLENQRTATSSSSGLSLCRP